MKRPLCPILLIGFNPPEEGQRDLRRCSTECALFNDDRDTCIFNAIYEKMEELDIVMQETIYGTYEDMYEEYEKETITKL